VAPPHVERSALLAQRARRSTGHVHHRRGVRMNVHTAEAHRRKQPLLGLLPTCGAGERTLHCVIDTWLPPAACHGSRCVAQPAPPSSHACWLTLKLRLYHASVGGSGARLTLSVRRYAARECGAGVCLSWVVDVSSGIPIDEFDISPAVSRIARFTGVTQGPEIVITVTEAPHGHARDVEGRGSFED
jgi:hypothetical protein